MSDYQPDLFGEPTARRTDPETSHRAADRMKPLAGADRITVLIAHFSHCGGLTDFELASFLGRQQTSVGKRRGELRDVGYIEATEIKRPAPSGSGAIVWRITERGKRAARELVNEPIS